MTVFQTVQHFEPQISVEYDQEKQLYIGQLLSRGGTYHLSGHDRATISYEVDAILQREYDQLVRDVGQEKGRSVGGASSSSSSSPAGRGEKMRGERVIDLSSPEERGRGISLINMLDVLTMIGPTLPSLAASAPLLKVLGIGTGLLQLFELLFAGGQKQKLAMVVGGVLIVAGSKRALMKKLMVHKNRILQNIMNNVRQTLKENEERREEGRKVSARLQSKRVQAKHDWVGRVGRDKDVLGRDWQERVDTARDRLREKKSVAAAGLWAER